MPVELGFIGPLIGLIKEVGSWAIRKFRKPDPVALLENRRKWKVEFEENLRWKDTSGTRSDAIIRDVKRMDDYPEIQEKERGISAWFKVEMKGVYHRGIEAFLSVETLVPLDDARSWRFGKHDEPEAINVLLVGRIPFDVIRSIDWSGDEFYPFPHIYCDFTNSERQPYEQLIFYAAHRGSTGEYFMELASLESVRKASKRHGIKHWAI